MPVEIDKCLIVFMPLNTTTGIPFSFVIHAYLLVKVGDLVSGKEGYSWRKC